MSDLTGILLVGAGTHAAGGTMATTTTPARDSHGFDQTPIWDELAERWNAIHETPAPPPAAPAKGKPRQTAGKK